ncbi:MAG: hypothetical protein R3E58_00315 [Phycisphaerae bacterium]
MSDRLALSALTELACIFLKWLRQSAHVGFTSLETVDLFGIVFVSDLALRRRTAVHRTDTNNLRNVDKASGWYPGRNQTICLGLRHTSHGNAIDIRNAPQWRRHLRSP